MIQIRRARIDEAEILSEIAANSEAYWGFDDDFMQKFREIYFISEEFIINNPTYVLEDEGAAIGFYSIIIDNEKAELEHFFISPEYMGKGYGKVLWDEMIRFCAKQHVGEIFMVTSPQAKEFYIKLGALFIEDIESLVRKGRIIPRLAYRVQCSEGVR